MQPHKAMSNGGKRLNELIKSKGFRLGAVAEAIGVNQNTMTRWTGNAPIEKLFLISDFTHIPILEIIECFNPDRDQLIPADRMEDENN
jgi:transcriptional regulator with XRE-family HTH domain